MAGFDTKDFMKRKFLDRTVEVAIPELALFFPEGVKPVFVVRGLTGEEFVRCEQSVDKTKGLLTLVEALNGSVPAQAAEIRKAIGLDSEDVPAALIYRFDVVEAGCVDPELSRDMIVKLGENYPTEVLRLSNTILNLTGMGREPGKPKGSGTTKE